MKHRHLNHSDFTIAAIDNIIERGLIPEWTPLMKEIEKDPFGEVARKTLVVCENHQVYGATAVFQKFIEQSRGKAVTKHPQY